MAKTKNKKKSISDKVRGKKAGNDNKVNPFEIKFNRQKHNVIGRKMAKEDQGMPGVSRSKANKKRKETLLVEYNKKTKVNKFLDRRIGENDPELSVEDKMLKRFATERQRHQGKSSVFNLNEDEELTHYGQSLADIEKFDDPVVSDDEANDEFGSGRGTIDAKMVGQEHFGGFLTRKKDDGKEERKHKTWKERMEEIIAQSKKAKHERQSLRQKALELTEQLDSEWKQLSHMMASSKKTKADTEEIKPQADDYDIAVRELKFEAKGLASDRLKTEEEIAKEESERLEKLEADRMRRMKGLTEEEERYRADIYRSADDLDDGLALGKDSKFEVTYKEGRLVGAEESGVESGGGEGSGEEDDEEGSDEEHSDDEDEDEDEAGENDEEGGDVAEDTKEDEDDEDSSSDAMEHTSDLESDEDSDADADQEKGEPEEGKAASGKKVSFSANVTVGPKDFKQLLKNRKSVMEAARKELPYTFKAPENYIELLNTFGDYSEDDQMVIIERMRKCNHPSLAEGNKAKLETLFGLLLEYMGDLALQEPPCLRLVDRLVRPLYELGQMSPLPAGLHVVALLRSREEEFSKYAEAHGGRGLFPTLDLLLQLKFMSQLFPTSDFHHHVITPAMLLMSQVLTQCPVNTRRDIASGLFVCSLMLEYTSFSKRYVPEVINFLRGVLFLAIKKDPNKLEPVIPPFKPVGRNIGFLELQDPTEAKKTDLSGFTLTDVFSRKKAAYLSTDKFRLEAIWQCVKLLKAFTDLYEELPCYTEIFRPIKYFLSKLPTENYPKQLKECIEELTRAVGKKEDAVRPPLVMTKHRPQPMKMFEPKVEDSFDGRRKLGGSREFAEKQRMLQKYKKEQKGAAREIRKDAQFLARQKLQERMEKDAVRKRKVKELHAQLASQEGDYKRLKREKDRL